MYMYIFRYDLYVYTCIYIVYMCIYIHILCHCRPVRRRPASCRPASRRPGSRHPASRRPASHGTAGRRPASRRPAGSRLASRCPASRRREDFDVCFDRSFSMLLCMRIYRHTYERILFELQLFVLRKATSALTWPKISRN